MYLGYISQVSSKTRVYKYISIRAFGQMGMMGIRAIWREGGGRGGGLRNRRNFRKTRSGFFGTDGGVLRLRQDTSKMYQSYYKDTTKRRETASIMHDRK